MSSIFLPHKPGQVCGYRRSEALWLPRLGHRGDVTAQLLLGHLSLEPSHHVVRKPDQPRGEAAWECPDQRPSPKFQPTASLPRDTMRDELAGDSSFQLSPRPSQPGPANAEQKPPVLPTATSPNARPTDSVSVTPGRLFGVVRNARGVTRTQWKVKGTPRFQAYRVSPSGPLNEPFNLEGFRLLVCKWQ